MFKPTCDARQPEAGRKERDRLSSSGKRSALTDRFGAGLRAGNGRQRRGLTAVALTGFFTFSPKNYTPGKYEYWERECRVRARSEERQLPITPLLRT